jgi:hypothetical protein
MEKNILSEIDQMKYLFGYKPGKVISEQVTPPVQTGAAETAPAKTGNTVTYSPPPLKMTNNDVIVKEILENLSKGIQIFASKLHPGKIVVVKKTLSPRRGVRTAFEDKYTALNYKRGMMDVLSDMKVDFQFIKDSPRIGGEIMSLIELYEDSIESALEKLNKNQGVVHKLEAVANNTNISMPLADAFMSLYYEMGQNVKATYDLMASAQPNILNNLRQSLYESVKSQPNKEMQEERNKIIQELNSVTGQQQQQ